MDSAKLGTWLDQGQPILGYFDVKTTSFAALVFSAGVAIDAA